MVSCAICNHDVIGYMQIHEQRLKAKGCYSDAQIRKALADVDEYAEFHRENPGFFDTAINTGTAVCVWGRGGGGGGGKRIFRDEGIFVEGEIYGGRGEIMVSEKYIIIYQWRLEYKGDGEI